MESDSIYGVFDGTNMIVKVDGAPDKVYGVPGNYASKSKLHEGDELAMRVINGRPIIKCVKEVPILFFRGVVHIHQDRRTFVENPDDGKMYAVIPAAASYHNLQNGTKVSASIPATLQASYAVIEMVLEY
jgi:hypothetical protein